MSRVTVATKWWYGLVHHEVDKNAIVASDFITRICGAMGVDVWLGIKEG